MLRPYMIGANAEGVAGRDDGRVQALPCKGKRASQRYRGSL